MKTSTSRVTADTTGPSSLAVVPHSLSGGSLDTALAGARREGRAALAAYMPAGYPTVARSAEVLMALAQHVDVLEVGLPHTFSDHATVRTAGDLC